MNTTENSRVQEQRDTRHSDGFFQSRVRAHALTARLFVGYGKLEYRPSDAQPTLSETPFWLTLVANEAGRAVCFGMSVAEPQADQVMTLVQAVVLTKHGFAREALHLTVEDRGIPWSSVASRAANAGVQVTFACPSTVGRTEPLLRKIQARLHEVADGRSIGRTSAAPTTGPWPAAFWAIRNLVEQALP